MLRRVILAGLLGGVVLVAWSFVVNGLFGFNARVNMKRIQEERAVYEVLRERIVEPGRYVCNPELTPERRFPEGEPVFSILYGGVGHEAAGREAVSGLVVYFLASLLAAGLLAQASGSVLSSYPRKVLFYAGIGLLMALFWNLREFGIANHPLPDALMLAGHTLVVWTVVGLAAGWLIKPARQG